MGVFGPRSASDRGSRKKIDRGQTAPRTRGGDAVGKLVRHRARGRRVIALGRELWRVGALPLLGVALLGACGGAGGPGDDDAANVSHSDPTAAVRETRPPFELGAQSAFYRLDLTRAADGTLSAAGVEL